MASSETTLVAEPAPIAVEDSPSRRSRIARAAKDVAVLSLAGTVAATATANILKGSIGGFAEAVRSPGSALDTGRTNLGGDPFVIKATASQGHQETLSSPAIQIDQTETATAKMPWALEFSQDPQATNTEQAAQAIQGVASQVQEHISDGYKVKEITVQGFASDEDDKTPGAGLNVPNPKNTELADTRARSAQELLDKDLAAQGVDAQVHLKAGEEVIDPSLNHRIDELAAARHKSVEDLVQQYNRDRDAFSKEDLKILDGLKDDRFVRITVEYEMVVPGTTESVTTEKHASIFLVPVVIPLWRRRRAKDAVGSAEPSGATIDEPVLGDAPVRPKLSRPVFPARRRAAFDLRPAYAGGFIESRHRIKQPRPYNNGQGGGRKLGGRINARMERAKGGHRG